MQSRAGDPDRKTAAMRHIVSAPDSPRFLLHRMPVPLQLQPDGIGAPEKNVASRCACAAPIPALSGVRRRPWREKKSLHGCARRCRLRLLTLPLVRRPLSARGRAPTRPPHRSAGTAAVLPAAQCGRGLRLMLKRVSSCLSSRRQSRSLKTSRTPDLGDHLRRGRFLTKSFNWCDQRCRL